VTAQRIGIFGGTFDPPHAGHRAAIAAAWSTGNFDVILVVVAGDPYEKSDVSSATERLRWSEDLFADLPGVVVSDIEILRGGPSYSVDTVEAIISDGSLATLIIGADVAEHLEQWRGSANLRQLCDVLIVARGNYAPRLDATWRWRYLDMDRIDISSSELRAQRNMENT